MSTAELGRRDRKKAAARTAIIESSTRLFTESGFGQTRIETIAAGADVGVGTVYNHFATKTDILVAILASDVGEVLERTRATVERAPGDGRDAAGVLTAVVAQLLEVMERRPRAMWRDCIGHALLGGGELGAAYERAERVLHGIVRRGLGAAAADAAVHSSADAGDVADVAFALAKGEVYRFVFGAGCTVADVVARLGRQLAIALPADR